MNAAVTLPQARQIATNLHKHAGGCKKDPLACLVCQANIAWFASLPKHILARVLQEKMV